MFKNNKFEIMYFNKRIAYFKDFDEQKPSLNPPFSSVYICHNVLPRQIVFEELKKSKIRGCICNPFVLLCKCKQSIQQLKE